MRSMVESAWVSNSGFSSRYASMGMRCPCRHCVRCSSRILATTSRMIPSIDAKFPAHAVESPFQLFAPPARGAAAVGGDVLPAAAGGTLVRQVSFLFRQAGADPIQELLAGDNRARR